MKTRAGSSALTVAGGRGTSTPSIAPYFLDSAWTSSSSCVRADQGLVTQNILPKWYDMAEPARLPAQSLLKMTGS